MGMTRWALLLVAGGAVVTGAPSVRAQEVACTDGLDDDADTRVDCWDRDCDPICLQSVTLNFREIGPPASTNTFRGVYYLSLPDYPLLDDVADSDPPMWTANGVCLGPGRGDGIINADDLLCTIFGSGTPMTGRGLLAFFRFDRTACGYDTRYLYFEYIFEELTSAGSWTAPLDPRDGIWVTVPFDVAADNVVTLRGWCDADAPPVVIGPPPSGCRPVLPILQVPWITPYRQADEILCGLEGVDWVDGDGDGDPDTCPNGIFDGTTPITVVSFDNDPDTVPESDNLRIGRTALRTDLGLAFLGRNFPLVRGAAYEAVVRLGHSPTLWDPPRTGPCR
jgi:hypothetical protein